MGKHVAEKKLAENHEGITCTMYEEVTNPDFNRAMNQAASTLETYWSREMRNISAYKAR